MMMRQTGQGASPPLALDVLDGQIQTIRTAINPDKLGRVSPFADAWATDYEGGPRIFVPVWDRPRSRCRGGCARKCRSSACSPRPEQCAGAHEPHGGGASQRYEVLHLSAPKPAALPVECLRTLLSQPVTPGW